MQHLTPRHEPRPLPLFLQMLVEIGGDDVAFTRRVLAGLRAYQNAIRPPRASAMPEIARVGPARILEYGKQGMPVLFVPSLINPPYVLDLAERNSLLRWLAQQGFRPLLLDWGERDGASKAFSVGDHVEHLLLPLLDQLGGEVVLAGYCLGGTIAIAAAATAKVSGLALIATPWDFAGYPEDAKSALARIWQSGASAAETLGLFPMEMLQSAFWSLDSRRTLEKFAAFGEMIPGSPEADTFVALEDWANEGPPLPLPAARELIEDMVDHNLPGTGRWKVAGQPIDPAALDCPILNIISTTDRIVPAATAAAVGERLILDQGHVGMIIGRRAQAALWQPLSAWLSQLRHSC